MIKESRLRRRNHIAKDLRSPKYRMRVEESKKKYNRKSTKRETFYEFETD
jgi:hypothetical protein